jgi:hypothetical protein
MLVLHAYLCNRKNGGHRVLCSPPDVRVRPLRRRGSADKYGPMGVRRMGIWHQLVQKMLSDVRAVQDGKKHWSTGAGQEEAGAGQY